MPEAVVDGWLADRDLWLRAHGIEPASTDWKVRLAALDAKSQSEFHDTFTMRWHKELDACHGACVLRRPELAAVVRDSLMHFDGERYDMHDFVVMPNHVHLLAVFLNHDAMLKQCESWKHYTASQINRRLDRAGRFWQQDAFDHLVRHEAQFQRLRRYIADNPTQARLRSGQFLLYRK